MNRSGRFPLRPRKPTAIFLFVFAALWGVIYMRQRLPRPAQPVVIEVQMFSGPEYEAMIPAAEYWNEHYASQTGITVATKALNRVGYFGKIETQLMAGLQKPDIVHPFSLHLGRLQPFLELLNPYLDDPRYMTAPDGKELSLGELLPFALQTVRAPDGRIFMIPKDMSEIILFYRKDLIAEPPKTWDEFIATAQKFTRRIHPGSPFEYGALMQGKYEMWTFCGALETIWPHGATIFTKDMVHFNFKHPGTARGLKIYEELARTGVFPPEAVNAEYPEVVKALREERVPMALLWNAAYHVLRDPRQAPLVHDRVAIAPPPGIRQPDGAIRRDMYVHTIGLAINKASRHKKEAMRFLTWVTLGEGAEIYARAGGSSPIKSVWQDQDDGAHYGQIGAWVREFGRAVPMHQYMADILMIGSEWVQKVMAGLVTAEEAVEGLTREAEELLHQIKE